MARLDYLLLLLLTHNPLPSFPFSVQPLHPLFLLSSLVALYFVFGCYPDRLGTDSHLNNGNLGVPCSLFAFHQLSLVHARAFTVSVMRLHAPPPYRLVRYRKCKFFLLYREVHARQKKLNSTRKMTNNESI